MKQELKDIIDELNDCFDYVCTKQKTIDISTREQNRADFLLGVVSSLYLESFQQNNVQYEIGIKNDQT